MEEMIVEMKWHLNLLWRGKSVMKKNKTIFMA